MICENCHCNVIMKMGYVFDPDIGKYQFFECPVCHRKTKIRNLTNPNSLVINPVISGKMFDL